jgi:hypothetical protein
MNRSACGLSVSRASATDATPSNINPLFKGGVYDPGKTAGKEAIHFTRKLAQGVDTREIGVDAVVAKQDGMSALGDSVHALLAMKPGN